MTVTHALPEPPVVRYRTRVPAFVDTSLRKIDRLSSGCKLDRSTVTSSDRQSDHLRRQLSSLDSALRVSSEAFTISGIAEGALGEMTSVLRDIRTAVLDAAGSAARGMASPGQPEIDAAIAKLDDIVRTTTYSGQTLLDGSRSLDYTATPADGTAADHPLLDQDHTRIDQVHNPNSAVVTVAFTPKSASTANAAPAPDAPIDAPPAGSDATVATATSASSAPAKSATTPATTTTTETQGPAPASASASVAVAESIPSDPARRAVLEADNAQPNTDVNGAAVTAAQEFVVTGSGGSRLFAFPSGTTLGEMADSLNAVADSIGVTATLVFASDVRVDTAVPPGLVESARSDGSAAGDAPVVLETVFPVHGTDGDVPERAGETPPAAGATGSGSVVAESVESDTISAPNAEGTTASPTAEEPVDTAAPAAADSAEDASAASTETGMNSDAAREFSAAPALPAVAVSPDLVHSLVPGLNCDPDGRLYIQANAEAGTFTVYADKDLTRAVGEVRDGFFIPAENASLSGLGPDALVIGSGPGSGIGTGTESGSASQYVQDGDVFVVAFAGLGLANGHDVTLSGDTDWFVPNHSLVNGVRLQDNTSRDGELHFLYTPVATRPDGTVATFQVDAFTDAANPAGSRVATSGPVSVRVPSSEAPIEVSSASATVSSSGSATVSVSETSSTPTSAPATASTSSAITTSATGTANENVPAGQTVPPETSVETVRLSPVPGPDGSDSGLYVALAVPLDSLPAEPATATAAFTNLGLRLTSRDYGSAAAISVQNRAGNLFRHPDNDHAVVAPGESVHITGADATVAINGQPVRTTGLTAAVATPEVTGSFTFAAGEPGNATIAVVGYDTGSVAAAAGRLAPEPPPAVRHEPAAATVTVGSPDAGAIDGLRDIDGNLVPVELDFTRLESTAVPVEPASVLTVTEVPVESASIPSAAAVPVEPASVLTIAEAPVESASVPGAATVPAASVTVSHVAAPVEVTPVQNANVPPIESNPTTTTTTATLAAEPNPTLRTTHIPTEPAPVPTVDTPPVDPTEAVHTDAVPVESTAVTTVTVGSAKLAPVPIASAEPAGNASPSVPSDTTGSTTPPPAAPASAPVPVASNTPSAAAPSASFSEMPEGATDAVSSTDGQTGTTPDAASTHIVPSTPITTTATASTASTTSTADASEDVTVPEQSVSAEQPAELDPVKPLGPLRVAGVTTPKSVSVEYVGEGTLKITCVTRDATGKPVSKTVVTEKVQPENLRAGYYITHPGLRGLFIRTAGKVSLEESHDPAVSNPVDVTEQSLSPLEGATTAATQPHQARRDELHSFRGGVPVAGEDDAVYAIQSLELDKIGRVSVGGKDYSLADVKLGGAANLAGNSLLTLQILAEATDDIAALRDRLGAFKANMLEHNIRSLDVAIENIAVTEHAIHDSRTAEERVSFTRGMMLDQSGTSILAQANQKSQNVISLLQ